MPGCKSPARLLSAGKMRTVRAMAGDGIKRLDPSFGENDDTNPDSLARRTPVIGWYLRTTRALGASRPVFLPFGYLALSGLAMFYGFVALEGLCHGLLRLLEQALAPLSSRGAALFDFSARRVQAPALAAVWASWIALRLSLGAIHTPPDDGSLGYVIPGSGWLARSWAVVGKRLYQLRQAVLGLARYLRDINLEKLWVPAAVLLLLALSFAPLSDGLANLLFEIPARFGSGGHASWIEPAARIASAVVVLAVGWPMLVHSVLRAHEKSVRRRKENRGGPVGRFLRGLFGLPFTLLPLLWMVLAWLSGR
jgi:hypothetical protein